MKKQFVLLAAIAVLMTSTSWAKTGEMTLLEMSSENIKCDYSEKNLRDDRAEARTKSRNVIRSRARSAKE